MAHLEGLVVEFAAAQGALVILRKRVTELRTEVLEKMREGGVDECGLPDGTVLVRKRTKTTEGLKKEHIAGELLKIVGSEAAADEMVANMYNRRVTGESEKLALLRPAPEESRA
jgi:hypothetical protein